MIRRQKIEYPSAICKVAIRLRLRETPESIMQACLPRRFCGLKARFFDSLCVLFAITLEICAIIWQFLALYN